MKGWVTQKRQLVSITGKTFGGGGGGRGGGGCDEFSTTGDDMTCPLAIVVEY